MGVKNWLNNQIVIERKNFFDLEKLICKIICNFDIERRNNDLFKILKNRTKFQTKYSSF